ncbi:hypothetical protein CRX67_17995 [Enterobacteriaceae bacterium A-F18]|nr:hypothetical protein C2U55_11815 [Enterobacteriaceae bacterium ENNIH3]AUV10233.1 hypothetical protein C2U52_30295 [Enterobacteriaceae bacterium ENNIH2]PWF51808.1 hypothetical protein BHT19_0013035 [[Kluyvera] intestini]QIH64821.1 hypothetical protein CRX67_17995 [Enterobacteriaceae bacterium A-F18]
MPVWTRQCSKPHVLHVRSGFCALSVFNQPAPITPTDSGICVLHFCLAKISLCLSKKSIKEGD